MATSQDNHTSNSHFTGEETETQRDLVICPESFSCKRWSWHLNPVSLAKASMLLTAIIVTTKLISRVLQNLREKATDMVRLLLALSCPRAAFLPSAGRHMVLSLRPYPYLSSRRMMDKSNNYNVCL